MSFGASGFGGRGGSFGSSFGGRGGSFGGRGGGQVGEDSGRNGFGSSPANADSEGSGGGSDKMGRGGGFGNSFGGRGGGDAGFGASFGGRGASAGGFSGRGGGNAGFGGGDSSFGGRGGSTTTGFGGGDSSFGGRGGGSTSGFGGRGGGSSTGFGRGFDNGGSGGFGGSADEGFGASKSFGGGGFGQGGGDRPPRGNGCFNCGEVGHNSRDCPNPRTGAGGPRKCNSCGEEGHISRNCPSAGNSGQPTGGSGFGGRGGFTQSGFRSFGEQKGENSSSGFGGGFGGASFGEKKSGCFNCGQEDHMSRDCTEPRKQSGECFNCGQSGHMSRDCPEPRKERGAPGVCYNCGQEGHQSRDCTEPRKERSPPGQCFNCGKDGHLSRDCTEPRKEPSGEMEGEGKPPASTYVPPDMEVDELYVETAIAAGSLFPKFFDQKVVVTRDGQKVDLGEFETFEDLTLPVQVAANVARAKYTVLTPIQKYGIPIITLGIDLLGCSQTGSGKTAAFLLPIMKKLISSHNLASSLESVARPRCIVVAPTRELANQIYFEGRKLSNGTMCNVAVVYGGTSVMYQRSAIAKGASIIVATIGRLMHFISEGIISLTEVSCIVVDEADRMLDMGFEGQMSELLRHKDIDTEKLQILMFSATFPVEVQTLARNFLKKDYVMVAVDAIGSANKCIMQEIVEASMAEKKVKLLELLNIDLKEYKADEQSDVFKMKTLVFVNTKKFADILGGIISQAGLPVTTIHGDRLQKQREEALADFRSGRTPVMIATAVAERGLDICNVDHVINYDLPDNRQDYVHRIGRTGRVGNAGRATSFYDSSKDGQIAKDLVEVIHEVEQVPPEFLLREAGMGSEKTGFGGRVAEGFTQAGEAKKVEEEEEW